jgi:hypothetical protein
MKRALTTNNILNTKRTYIAWHNDTEMEAALGNPETCGVWLVWGHSGNGKSNFVFKLIKALSAIGNILYDSLEEGNSASFKKKLIEHRMHELGSKIKYVQDDMAELQVRLDKKNSSKIVVIDSYQYTDLNYKQYKLFKAKYPNKIIIFVSHADCKKPTGRSANSVMYDAYMKIWIEGYQAFCKGREIGENGGTYIIWEEGAERYWGQQ